MNIKKDFFKGISQFAKTYGVEESKIQVRISINDEDGEPLRYYVCVDWQPKALTDYNEVMGSKIINITEGLVVPILHQNMVKWARTLEVPFESFSAFLSKYKEDNIAVNLHDGTEWRKISLIDEFLG